MSSWLVRPASKPSPSWRLFCVPFAGVGPSAFRGWSQSLPSSIETMYVHLPGRESRLREATIPDVSRLAQGIADAIAPFADESYALFGHSLGGLIAFEVARALRERGVPAPVRLFTSACRAPHVPSPFPPLHRLDEDALLGQLNERYGGSVPAEVMESPELRELLVPTLRADLTALETYQYRAQPALECPITAFGGTADGTLPSEHIEAWSTHTSGEFRLRLIDSGHLYLQSARQQLIDHIREDVGTVLPPRPLARV